MQRTALAIAVVLLALPMPGASAGKRTAPPRVRGLVSPRGVQGIAGEGANVAIAFRLADRASRPADVELQYAVDLDEDGRIEDEEYRAAVEDPADPRSTRGSGGPGRFATSRGRGTDHEIVWRSRADLVGELAMRARKRDQRSGIGAGVRIRLRATGDDGRPGAWAVSRPFEVDNRLPPDVRIGQVWYGPQLTVAGHVIAKIVDVEWRAVDADSEDADADGALGPSEDANGDGSLDAPKVTVTFWYHEPTEDERHSALTDPSFDMSPLDWHRCVRANRPAVATDSAVGGAGRDDASAPHVFEWSAPDLASWSIAYPTDWWLNPPKSWIFLRADPASEGVLGPTRYLLTTIEHRLQ